MRRRTLGRKRKLQQRDAVRKTISRTFKKNGIDPRMAANTIVVFKMLPDYRAATASGTPKKSRITINEHYWCIISAKARTGLIVHEACHVVANNVNPTHGPRWIKAMGKVGKTYKTVAKAYFKWFNRKMAKANALVEQAADILEKVGP